jgi:hypothetical protein
MRRRLRKQQKCDRMNIVPTELNRHLASAIQYSIAADRFNIAGKAGFWRLIGAGLIVFGIGTAVGIGFYGFARVARNLTNETALLSAFSKALSEAQLHGKAEGTVKIEPHELSLSKGQTISIDQSSLLHLDPAAKVTASGELQVQAPSISIPQPAPSVSRAAMPPITDFTVFKSVPFQDGDVLTGWRFLTSAQSLPTSQYCYYSPNLETPGMGLRINIASDGKLDATVKDLPKGFDIASAFDKCVWYDDARK